MGEANERRGVLPAGWVASIRVTAALVLVVSVAIVGYWVTGDKLDDVVLLVGGSLVGYLVGLARSAFANDRSLRRLRRRQAAVEQLVDSTQAERAISMGRLVIPNGALVTISSPGHRASSHVEFQFGSDLSDPRPDPALWSQLQMTRLPLLQNRAKEQSRSFDNGTRLDLVGVRVERKPTNRTLTPTTYVMSVAETDYFRFACMSNMLDHPVEGSADSRTLREIWDDHPDELADLPDVSAPACIGIVVVVASRPDQMIVCQERGRLHQAGYQMRGLKRVHFMGEGMLSSDRLPTGEFSPRVGAIRGMSEELKIEDRTGDEVDLVQTGVFLDIQRWQPVFCYLALVDRDFETIQAGLAEAKDGHETRALWARPLSVRNPGTRDLLLGQDGRLVLASNHAQAALLLALIQVDGLATVQDLLRAPAATGR